MFDCSSAWKAYILKNAILLLILTLILLQGCATRGKPANLPNDLPDSWAGEAKVTSLPITCSLLDLISDNRLEELVREALENNHNLRATAFRLKASGYMLTSTKSRLWPSVNVGFSKGRDNEGTDPMTGKRLTENRHQASLNVSWEIDLWGRLADEHASARLTYKAQANEYTHARDALGARVIQAWFNAIATQQAMHIEQERVEALKNIEETLVRRYRQGLGSLDELSTAKTRTEVARADLSNTLDEHLRTLRALEVLIGRYPRGTLLAADELPIVSPPPVSVPAAVLKNRPDVQAALSRVGSAEKTASAAEKALMPDIRLSAKIFKENASLGNISGASTLWSILGSLTQPVFEGGRLKDEFKARLLESDAAFAEFFSVILQAMKEAEDAFGREKGLSVQEASLTAASKEAERSRRYFEQRYRNGLDTILNLLIAREQETNIRRRLVEIRAARLSNRVDLALSLGIGV